MPWLDPPRGRADIYTATSTTPAAAAAAAAAATAATSATPTAPTAPTTAAVAIIAAIAALAPMGLYAAPWDPSPDPYLLQGELIDVTQDRTISRVLHLQQESGFNVAPGAGLDVNAPILGHTLDPFIDLSLWKLGAGHLQLNAQNGLRTTIYLRQGSLGVGPEGDLGPAGNELHMAAGTRLDLADGLVLPIKLRAWAPGQAPDPWAWPLPAESIAPGAMADGVTLRVAQGTAQWLGDIDAQAPLYKTGAGTLRLAGLAGPGLGATLNDLAVLEGGLQMDSSWWGVVTTAPGTLLSGTGSMASAQVYGTVQPGTPEQVGTLGFIDHLGLQPESRTLIRVDAQGHNDQLWSMGTARLAGTLQVDLTRGDWSPSQSWEIVRADGGLLYDSDTSASTPAPTSTSTSTSTSAPAPAPAGGQYAHVTSNIRYLDPVLHYGADNVILRLRYNRLATLTGEADWRSALLDDSRFLREAAQWHAARGGVWAQGWGAQARRAGAWQRAGDRRHTQGLQLGYSHRLRPGAYVAAYAGVQHMRLQGDQPVSDQAAHLGLAAGVATGPLQWSAGLAHGWHHAQASRRAEVDEPRLHTTLQAGLTQAWIGVAPRDPWILGAPSAGGHWRDRRDGRGWHGWRIWPQLQLTGLRLHRRAAEESRAQDSLAAVHLPAQTDRRWMVEPAVNLQRQWPGAQGPLQLSLRLGWRQLWGAGSLHSEQTWQADPSQGASVASLPLARHVLRVDLGLQVPLSSQMSAHLGYAGQMGSGQQQHGAWLGLNLWLDGKRELGSNSRPVR